MSSRRSCNPILSTVFPQLEDVNYIEHYGLKRRQLAASDKYFSFSLSCMHMSRESFICSAQDLTLIAIKTKGDELFVISWANWCLLTASFLLCRFEKISVFHSWNANWLFTNSIIFSLQRHSDHHENAHKPYQVRLYTFKHFRRKHQELLVGFSFDWQQWNLPVIVSGFMTWQCLFGLQMLENIPEAPQLPASYPAMMLLSLFPGIFFDVMDPRVMQTANRRADKALLE